MTWIETDTMKEKTKFVFANEERDCSFTELCYSFNVCRKTGHKWVNRYKEEGLDGLRERSRAPHSSHNKTAEAIQHMILQAKMDRPHWGPNKIIHWLSQEHPTIQWPAVSTAGEILKRHGMVKPRKKRQRVLPYTQPFGLCKAANASWSIDYKGQFKLGNQAWCYPLTVTDSFSRYLLACDGFKRISGDGVKTVLERLFKENGLPDAIRSDNGSPFAGRSLAGISLLSVWLIKLGIKHERIRAGHPEENGRHERMHRTLKQETAKPPEEDMFLQQLAFNRFTNEYNMNRPHEGINNNRPSWLYEASLRQYPYYLEDIGYGDDYTTRMIRTKGTMKWNGKEIFISSVLCGERVGMLAISEVEWEIYFSTQLLGIFNEKIGQVSNIK